MSAAREAALVAAAESGDAAARATLVDVFLPHVVHMARIYQRSSSVDRTELVQSGVVGLLRASARYDPMMGTPFWAYASWWVRQAMQQLVAELTGPMVLSDRALRQLARLRDARRDHLARRGREPSIAELSKASGLSRGQVDSLLVAERAPRGLDEPLGGDDALGTTIGDLVADPTSEDPFARVIEDIEIDEVQGLAAALTARERGILSSHYGLGRPPETLSEIAQKLGVSGERVRQIESRALEKLREAATLPRPASTPFHRRSDGLWT